MSKESQRKWKLENGKWKIETRNTKLENWCGKIINAPTGEPEKWKVSNKEIEDEKKEAEEEKDGGTVDAAARKVGYGTDESHWDGLETGFFPGSVERASQRVAGKIAAEEGKFILKPCEEITANAPHERATSHE